MTQCKKCVNGKDCWIKATINGVRYYPTSEREQQICIRASHDDCDCFVQKE